MNDLVKAGEFFSFMLERELIRLRKKADQPFPWTEDSILQTYKFTNVRRWHDRTTTFLREIFYSKHVDADRKEILMNCALFRYFGTSEFADVIGWQKFDDFRFQDIINIAQQRLAGGKRVFTGAYVITNQGISAPKQEVVVNHFLKALHEKAQEICELVETEGSWKRVVQLMSSINGFGGTGFMAKEILLDTMMTNFWLVPETEEQKFFEGCKVSYPVDYDTWTPIGPGGLRGAARILGHNDPEGVLKQDKALEVILKLADKQGLFWPSIYGKLYPTDLQFQLCEFDKYERVRLGQGRPRSKYQR